MTKLVTVFGGSGFLGRYVSQRMAQEGWRVRVATRRPNEALFVRTYGTPGQVEPVLCNIRDKRSVQNALAGADAVVNCVGILNEIGANSFEAVQNEGARRVARAAKQANVTSLVHLSAIGARDDAQSAYSRSKAAGEAAVLEQFPNAVILRPSVMFGVEDSFFNKFANLTKWGPVLPLVGGNTQMQPVFVQDVAKVAVAATLGKVNPGVYELGGPHVHTLGELVQMLLKIIERRRLVLNLPFWAGGVIAGVFDMVQAVTLGLVANGVLTRDQVKSLKADNIVGQDAPGFDELGIEPVSMAAVLPEYLWAYRPSGEFSAIKKSAQNLRTKI